MGSWTAYLISVLYVEYRTRKEKEGVSFKNHVIQVLTQNLSSIAPKFNHSPFFLISSCFPLSKWVLKGGIKFLLIPFLSFIPGGHEV